MHGASYGVVEPLCSGEDLLDLGCGSGYGTHRISKLAEEAHGLDVAGDAIAYAKSHYTNENLHFLKVQADSPLPYPAASFDVVLSFQVIEHVLDDDAYLREARRILKPGGTLVVIRSEEHTSELQSLMRISYAVFCLKKKKMLQSERQH